MKDRINILRRNSSKLIVIFISMSFLIIVTGYLYYYRFENNYKDMVFSSIKSITEEKISEISYWQNERFKDAEFFNNKVFSELICAYLKNQKRSILKRDITTIIKSINTNNNYQSITVLDANLKNHLIISNDSTSGNVSIQNQSLDSLRIGKIIFEEFYYDSLKNKTYFDILSPIFDKSSNKLYAIIVLKVDVNNYLYPLIKTLPIKFKTSESILFRRFRDTMLCLSEMKFHKNSTLKYKLPINRKGWEWINLGKNRDSLYVGRSDYGEKIVSYYNIIPNSNWIIVTCVAKSDVYSPLKNELLIVIGIILVLLVNNVICLKFLSNKQLLNILQEKNDIIESNLYQKKALIDELTVSETNLKSSIATKDKFFSIIAHDLRNPLGNFKNVTELLFNSYNELTEEEKLEFISLMYESSKNTYSLLENLLEWSRTQIGTLLYNPVEFNLKMLSFDILKLLKSSADNKHIKLIVKISDSINIKADMNMIQTIIRNLISNAIKFTPENGLITLNAFNSNDTTIISVQDTGVGMSQETIDKLFRIDIPVSTLGTNYEVGTGLGLILCKEFVEKRQGKIWVESELGKGSIFYISLPRFID
jgi:signal transduction histidine kinase